MLDSVQRTVDGAIDDTYHHTDAMNYGSMPHGMLAAKFEETDLPSEDVYNNYSRNLLTDHTPDTNMMAYEEPHGSTDKQAGFLNFRYNGSCTRGSVYDDPYRPEYFDGFAGGDDRDPRGINVDPDMRELTKQEQARMRFIRLTPDGSDQVTGGGLSEAQVMANQQKVFRTVRGKLKVFDRQLDGRREGLRRVYGYKSQYSNVQGNISSYGDAITDAALTPQKRANKICQQVLRNSTAWREETADANFAIAQYGQFGRKRKCATTYNTVADAINGADGDFSDADASKCYKTAGILMQTIVNNKRNGMAAGDADHGQSTESVARKSAALTRDLIAVTKQATVDGKFATSDTHVQGKTASPQRRAHGVRRVVSNHLTPAHHYLNAEIMYKSVREGRDLRATHGKIITDASAPSVRDVSSIVVKSARRELRSGAKLGIDNKHADLGDSRRTASYKHVKQCNGDRRSRMTSEDGYIGVGDTSQVRRPGVWNSRIQHPNDTVYMRDFGPDDTDRLRVAPLGSKKVRAHMDTDGRDTATFGNGVGDSA
mgnify:CR=1 FL=1